MCNSVVKPGSNSSSVCSAVSSSIVEEMYTCWEKSMKNVRQEESRCEIRYEEQVRD